MQFSVLLSVYKKEKTEYLKMSLNSIRFQTLAPDEVILIEDGPLTKELYLVIEEYLKILPNMRVYKFDENQGLGLALRKGMELSKYELVARMDTDDIAEPERFKIQKDFMEKNPHISVCGGLMREFDDRGIISQVKNMPETQKEIWEYAKYRNPINHMTVMFRKADVLKAGNYRDFSFLEDYDLWCRMLAKDYKFYNVQKVLVKARVSDEMYNRRGGIVYCRRYLRLRQMQKEIGLLGFGEYVKACGVTILITLVPNMIRKLVYIKMLRKRNG